MGKVILVTGGARSGKSSFALELAEKIGNRRLFVATCPNLDQEMNERVARHQEERRGRDWETAEVEIALDAIFPDRVAGYDVVLIDCLTLWINNLLYASEQRNATLNDHQVTEAVGKWLAGAEGFAGTVICVTNEVGLGIVPDNKLARLYRDLVGTCNQTIGRRADEVILVSCGIPLYLK